VRHKNQDWIQRSPVPTMQHISRRAHTARPFCRYLWMPATLYNLRGSHVCAGKTLWCLALSIWGLVYAERISPIFDENLKFEIVHGGVVVGDFHTSDLASPSRLPRLKLSTLVQPLLAPNHDFPYFFRFKTIFSHPGKLEPLFSSQLTACRP
jgi:hypothetical protein